MRRPLWLVAMLGAAAALCLLPSSALTAAPMPAVTPDAVHGSLGGTIVQPAGCIRYCVRRELCQVANGRRTCHSTSYRKAPCVEWATACKGGHY